MRNSFGVSVSVTSGAMVMRLALLIGGEAMISLGAKVVRHTGCTVAALNYGNVRNVSQLGKNRGGLSIQSDSDSRFLTLCQAGPNSWFKI
jgi:hypothetical protein